MPLRATALAAFDRAHQSEGAARGGYPAARGGYPAARGGYPAARAARLSSGASASALTSVLTPSELEARQLEKEGRRLTRSKRRDEKETLTLTPTLALALALALTLSLSLSLAQALTLTLTRRRAGTPTSPSYLAYISPTSPLCLPGDAPAPLHLPHISPRSPPHLRYVSQETRRLARIARKQRIGGVLLARQVG